MSTRSLVEGTANFRDVAASLGASKHAGARVRPGVFYRSDALTEVSSLGLGQLDGLGLARIVDLRSVPEAQAAPDVLPDDVEATSVPLLQGRQDAPSGFDLTSMPPLVQLYTSLLEENSADLVSVISIVARTPGATLVHCAAGKDRTGVVSALVLSAVGVDRDDVVADYAITESRLSGAWEALQLRRLEAHGVSITQSLRDLMVASPPEAMDATLDLLESHYGGARNYLLDAGLDAEELSTLEQKLLV